MDGIVYVGKRKMGRKWLRGLLVECRLSPSWGSTADDGLLIKKASAKKQEKAGDYQNFLGRYVSTKLVRCGGGNHRSDCAEGESSARLSFIAPFVIIDELDLVRRERLDMRGWSFHAGVQVRYAGRSYFLRSHDLNRRTNPTERTFHGKITVGIHAAIKLLGRLSMQASNFSSHILHASMPACDSHGRISYQ